MRAVKFLYCKMAVSRMTIDGGVHCWLAALLTGIAEIEAQRHSLCDGVSIGRLKSPRGGAAHRIGSLLRLGEKDAVQVKTSNHTYAAWKLMVTRRAIRHTPV